MSNPRGFDPQWIHDETWEIWFPQTGAVLMLELNLPRSLVLELETSGKFSLRTTFKGRAHLYTFAYRRYPEKA